MSINQRLYRISAILLACLTTAAFAAEPPSAASGCKDCHGTNGVSTKSEIPTIAGMSAFYLEGQMQAYQKDQRLCVKIEVKNEKIDMCEVAKKMNAAQITEVATYYAGQKFVAAKQTIDAGLAAKGKSLHDSHCEICHSDGGSEAVDDAGILAGQWKPYLSATLQEYHDGKRAEPKKMKTKTAGLSADDFKALVEFYASDTSR